MWQQYNPDRSCRRRLDSSHASNAFSVIKSHRLHFALASPDIPHHQMLKADMAYISQLFQSIIKIHALLGVSLSCLFVCWLFVCWKCLKITRRRKFPSQQLKIYSSFINLADDRGAVLFEIRQRL